MWRRQDPRIGDEVRFHRDRLIEDYVASGLDRQEAERRAFLELGNPVAVEESVRDVRGRRLEDFGKDVRYALRTLRRSPAFAVVAILTLALGIGVNSAIFALVDAALIRPLPFPEPDRLVSAFERTASFPRGPVAPLNFHDWHDRNRTFESMAASATYARRMTAADGSAEQIPAQQVTPGFFELFDVRPVTGRTFLPSDVAVPPSIAVISEGLWRNRFDSDPGVVGRVVQIDAQPFTIVGVIPADFEIFGRADLWTVWAELPGMDARTARFMRVTGRLRPGVTPQVAQEDLARIAAELAREYPASNKDRSVTVEPLRDSLINADLRSTSMLFLGVVGFVLLMCCANVANLLLARTAGRARELAVRSALGAGRLRVVLQLLTESVVLAVLGGTLGLGLGAMILRVAPATIPPGILPPDIALVFDGRVVLFCAATTLLVGLLFGIVPAWQATGVSLVQVLTSDGRGTTRGGGRLRSLLVIGEVAAAVLLLCGAGLLLRTLIAYNGVHVGHRANNVLTVQPSMDYGLPSSMFRDEDALRRFFEGIERELNGVPGVESAGWGTSLPLWGFAPSPFEIVDDPAQDASILVADRQLVSPGYLPTLGVPIVAGRNFTEQDTAAGVPVCIVSESLVRQHFGGRNPIGARIAVRRQQLGRAQTVVREIVGVAGDLRRNLGTEEARAIYVPMSQNPWSFTVLVVKPAAGNAEALVPAVRAAVARVDRRVPLAAIRTLDDSLRFVSARPRFRAVMVTTFAGLALVLAMIGVFGVMAYSVQQRSREFGVRIALGANSTSVLKLVLGAAGRLIGTGALVGLVLAAMLAQSISAFLFGVQPLDPLTFVLVTAVLGATAAIACAVPALRATRVNPIVAFRND
jgi:putative ABC transport system permease protein